PTKRRRNCSAVWRTRQIFFEMQYRWGRRLVFQQTTQFAAPIPTQSQSQDQSDCNSARRRVVSTQDSSDGSDHYERPENRRNAPVPQHMPRISIQAVPRSDAATLLANSSANYTPTSSRWPI